jgi:hypothetical protein
MKLVIAGSRGIKNALAWVERGVKHFYNAVPDLIISGSSGNVDEAAIDYALQHGIRQEIYRADWNTYGRAAGPIRNREMAELGEQLLVVWDGRSRGTLDMMRQMHSRGKRVCVAKVAGDSIEFYEQEDRPCEAL